VEQPPNQAEREEVGECAGEAKPEAKGTTEDATANPPELQEAQHERGMVHLADLQQLAVEPNLGSIPIQIGDVAGMRLLLHLFEGLDVIGAVRCGGESDFY
jgi:hypothetical protein